MLIRKTLVVILIISTLSTHSQNLESDLSGFVDELYSTIEPELIPTGVLLDKGFNNITNLFPSNVTLSDYHNYWAIYNSLQKCRHGLPDQSILPEYDGLIDWEYYQNNESVPVPLSYIFYEGNYLGEKEVLKLIEDRSYKPLVKNKTIFSLSTLTPFINKSTVTFSLQEELVFSNVIKEIDRLEIDFGDGLGYRVINPTTEKITVYYECIGEKSIVAKLIKNGEEFVSNSKIQIDYLDLIEVGRKNKETVGSDNLRTAFSSNSQVETIDGGTFLRSLGSDNVLNKPILLIEGFDLMNNASAIELYQNWDVELDELMNNGYDVITLSFSDAKKSMLTNSEVVERMIKKINADKVGDFEGVIIGESMGGILARVALRELENDGYDHQFGLYVSFDAPHKGANLPLGLQGAFIDAVNESSKFSSFVDPFFTIFQQVFGNVVSASILNNSLNSTAANQLLHRKYGSNVEFYEMQNYLEQLGYPENTRNVTLINGNNQANNLPFVPGTRMYFQQWLISLLLGKYHKLEIMTGDVNVSQQRVSELTVFKPASLSNPFPSYRHVTRYVSNGNKSYDNSPGGVYEIPEVSTLGFDWVAPEINSFCFVPTSSAIDLENSIYYSSIGLHRLSATYTKDDVIDNGETPFDDIYAGIISTNHVHKKIWYSSETPGNNPLEDLIDLEVMFDDLFIEGRTIKYNRDFESTNTISVGNSVDTQIGKNTKKGDVIFTSGNTITLSSPEIVLSTGTKIESGCNFRATPTSTEGTGTGRVAHLKKYIAQVPVISTKKVDGERLFYIKKINEELVSSVSWEIYSNDFEYQSFSSELQVPSDIPSGQYTLRVESSSSGEGFQTITKVFYVLGDENQTISNTSESFVVETFPNPANGMIYINNSGREGSFKVSLIDLEGKVLLEKNFDQNGALDVSKYKGFFLLKIEQGSEVVMRRIISH